LIFSVEISRFTRIITSSISAQLKIGSARVAGFIESNATSAGKSDARKDAPTFLVRCGTLYVGALEASDGHLEVVAQEVEFVPTVRFGGMESRF
jgi:hypothetical protein